jgi:multiple sugar transport system permease protein
MSGILDTPAGAVKPARRPRRIVNARSVPYVLLLPFLALFAVFGVFPLLFSLYLAFQSWEPTSGLSAMQFVGFDNFVFALQDAWFWKSMGNTLWLAVASGVPQHAVAVPVACFIHAVAGRVFTLFASTDYGVVNTALGIVREWPLVGALVPAERIDWIGDPEYIKPALAGMVFWRYVGFNVVLYLAGLQAIPKDLYEAARIDGAGTLARFRHVTLPGLRPMMVFGFTLSVIGGLQLFEEPFIFTPDGRGGSDQAGMTAAVYLYRTAFDFNDFGAASAMSWLLFIAVAAATWMTQRAFRSRR